MPPFIGQRERREMTPLTGHKDLFMVLAWTREAGLFRSDWPAPREIQHVQKRWTAKANAFLVLNERRLESWQNRPNPLREDCDTGRSVLGYFPGDRMVS